MGRMWGDDAVALTGKAALTGQSFKGVSSPQVIYRRLQASGSGAGPHVVFLLTARHIRFVGHLLYYVRRAKDRIATGFFAFSAANLAFVTPFTLPMWGK